MNHRLLLVILLSLAVFSSASAQYIVVGPPDDLTYIDTTGGYSPSKYTPPSLINLGSRTVLPVDTIHIAQLDCSLFPLICAYVEALDSLGNPIGGLTADSFCVSQDGTPIPIGDFTVQELTLDSCITSICLVIDVSGSMGGSLINAAKDAARRFVRNMDAYDRVAIVSFASSVTTVQTFTSDTTLLISKINGLVASGNTACFDGVWQGVNVTIPELGSKAVIAFTDGLENRSHITPQPPDGVGSPATDPYTDDSTIICNLANGAGIPIYTFNLGSITNTYYNPEAMQAFATGTGGFWRHAPSPAQIDSIYDEIKIRLCSRYKICYTSLDTIPSGDYHATQICHYVGGMCVGCDVDSCQETTPPTIVRTPPTEDLSDTCQLRNEPVQICVKVTDPDTPPASFTVRLFYRLVGSPSYPTYTDVAMTQLGGVNDSIFCYTISGGLNCRSAIEYYITASDGAHTLSSPLFNPQTQPYSIDICPNEPPVATCPGDTNITLCSLSQICIPGFSASDPDGNLATKTVSLGMLTGNQVCFNPVVGANVIQFIATDSCGLADTCNTTVNVTLNSAPVASCPNNSVVASCGAGQQCVTGFVATDVNNNIVSKTISFGTLNDSTVCFDADTTGIYVLKFIATDACGKADTCETQVQVVLNSPPVATCHADTAMFVCSLAQICLSGYSATDPNNNLSTVVAQGGTLNGNQICFTPVAGVNTIKLIATDACGVADTCETSVTVTLNAPPDAQCHGDTTIFVCNLNQICLSGFSATDPNGNLVSTVLTGGTLNANQACFTPVVGLNQLKLVATDACGAKDSCITNVTIQLNSAPTVTCPGNSALMVCSLDPLCINGFSATDPNGNLSTVTVNTGTFNGSQVCFTPVAGPNLIRLIATDACGAADTCETTVTVSVNLPPAASCPNDTALYLCSPGQVCIAGFSASDPDNNLSNVYAIGGTLNGNEVCFTPVAGLNVIQLVAEDDCERADTCTTNIMVTFNTPPVATCPPTNQVFICDLQPICIQGFSASDVDGNLLSVTVSPGTLNGNQICFTPVAGLNVLTLIATDACGVADTCESNITVVVNTPPTVTCVGDTTIFACNMNQICLPFSVSDPDGNIAETHVTTPGTIVGNNICFTPQAGLNVFTVYAIDECYDTTACIMNVTVMLNSPPALTCPGNNTMFVCNLNEICVPGFSATDPDGNMTSVQATGGTIQGNQLCFVPVVGANQIRVIATDACGAADTCFTTININLNAAPVANAGPDQNLNCRASGVPICWNASCTDVDGNLQSCQLVSPVGTYNGTQICFSPTSSGSYSFVLRATDVCGAVDYDTAVVQVQLNSAPELSLSPSDASFQCIDEPILEICVPFTYSDPNGNVEEIVLSGLPGGILNYAGGSGTVCYTPVDDSTDFAFDLTVDDSCGLSDVASHHQLVVPVDCDTATCFVAQIEKSHNTLQGHYEYLSVTLSSDALPLGGFDFLIKYDNSGLSFVEAQVGQLLIDCGWEYFTYRFGATGNCNGPCPSGLIRVVALADANNGNNHPSCFGAPDDLAHEIFILKFLVTNDRTFECQYLPVVFYWIDCGDNTISSPTGDTLYLDKRIYRFDGSELWDELDNALYPESSRPFGVGAPDYCLIGDKYYPIRCIEFIEGGVDVVCADSIDAPGDVNLNGVSYEIADAVLYTNYFLYGLGALDPDPIRREAQIAASDANRDGTPLSVGDLVYVLRVVVGDALPLGKLSPFSNTASIKWQDGTLYSQAGVEIGALLAKFDVTGEYSIENSSGIEMLTSYADGELVVLLYPGMNNMTAHIPSGSNQLLRLAGDVQLTEVEVSDYDGNLLTAAISKSTLPKEFALRQNRPNPFNPLTQIELDLPIATDWKIEIFNITGQLVHTLSGTGQGRVITSWDAASAPSGVYLYRASAGPFTETRKMLLLK